MQLIFWLIAILIAAGAGYLVYRADKRRAIPYPLATSLLRGLVVFFTLLLILVPNITITKNITEKPVVLLLQDNSLSIANALGNDSMRYHKDVAALAARLSGEYKVVEWGFGARIQQDSVFRYLQPATDISAAMSEAQEYFGLQNLGAVIVASDGRFNQGENPIYQQLSLHSPVYTVGIGDSAVQKDIRITKLYANKTVLINSSFEIRADVVAALCKGYDNSISVKEDGNTILSVPLAVTADRYDRSVSFTVKADKPGLHHYIITVPEAVGEKNTANNRKDVFVDVIDEKKNILIASAAPDPDINAIKEALSDMERYSITVCTADNFPADLKPYNILILHGLPSKRTHITQQLIAAGKPLWLIVSNQSDIQAINELKDITHITMSPTQQHDMAGIYDPSFNTFTVPRQIPSVIDKMPPLTLNVTNIVAAPGQGTLISQKTNNGNGQAPLWMLQSGKIPAAILLSEGIWRWRLYEFKNFNDHAVIDECIRQTVSFLSVNNSEKPFSVALSKYIWSDQENISLNAYLLNASREQVNTPDAQITITDGAGRKHDFSLERSGSAYNLNIGIWAGGTYTYTAKTTYNGTAYTAAGKFVVESTQPELMQPGADYGLLYSLARKYNGGFVPSVKIASLYDSITHNEHIKPVIQTNTESQPLVDRKWYFIIILILATCEWLLRKYWLAQ